MSLLRPLALLRRTLAAHRRALQSSSTASPSSAASSAPPPPPPHPPAPKGAYVLPLPKLSHLMQSGAVAAWRVREGDAFPAYAILAEVETASLVEPCYAQGAFAGRVRMLIEAQQPGVVARLLVPAAAPAAAAAAGAGEGGEGGRAAGAGGEAEADAEGARDLPVGTPIAIVVGEDELEDAGAEAEEQGADPAAARARLVAAARAWRVPTGDVLDGAQPSVPVLEWQSYLASSSGGGDGEGGQGGGGGGMCGPGAGGS